MKLDTLTEVESAIAISLSRGYKTFFMLNSTDHEIFPAHKC